MPIDFALVLDESGSMKKPLPDGSLEGANGSKALAHKLVRMYSLGVDAARFSVVSFAANATTRVGWSYNKSKINEGIDDMSADGKSSISDGFEAVRHRSLLHCYLPLTRSTPRPSLTVSAAPTCSLLRSGSLRSSCMRPLVGGA